MTKYRNYKNKLEMFLGSRRGRRFLNIAYSWGAAVVILGALFKLLHWPFGNEMLFIGMVTEFLIFFISGLEQPEEQYHWEQVYPELLSINPMDRREMEERRKYLAHKSEEVRHKIEEEYHSMPEYSEEAYTPQPMHSGYTASTAALGAALPQEEVERLSKSLVSLEEAIGRLTKLSELSADTLSDWKDFTQNVGQLGQDTAAYSERMKGINQTISSLQSLYESQLKDIEQQVNAIDHINHRLDDMRAAYESSYRHSDAFQHENAEMVRRLHELNRVYARLLEAMTVNMMAPGGGYPYSSGYNTMPSTDYGHPYHRPEYPHEHREGNTPA